jgi:two-component system LytT family response regulator
MKKYNVIVIEDEKNIREALHDLLVKNCPEVEVCGVAGSAEEGRYLLKVFDVDFIFLDIAMPNEDGFEFLETIHSSEYGIIFTTAYQEYALRALRANAVDYLLKPISSEELSLAVTKAIQNYNLRKGNAEWQRIYHESITNLRGIIQSDNPVISRITVTDQFGFKIIKINELMYLLADSNYTELYLSNGSKIVSTRNLGEYEKIINSLEFFRIHKSYLVNVNYITGYSNYEGNFAEMKDGRLLSISRRKVVDFRNWIKKFSGTIE